MDEECRDWGKEEHSSFQTAEALSACTSVHRSMLRLFAMLKGYCVRSKEVDNCYLLGLM